MVSKAPSGFGADGGGGGGEVGGHEASVGGWLGECQGANGALTPRPPLPTSRARGFVVRVWRCGRFHGVPSFTVGPRICRGAAIPHPRPLSLALPRADGHVA